jgi:hypothetical protein
MAAHAPLDAPQAQLGGDNLEVAHKSTKMEVRLAQALQQAAALRAENEALQRDVAGMIELKLQVGDTCRTVAHAPTHATRTRAEPC